MLSVIKKHLFAGHSGAIYALEEGLDEFLFYSGSSDKFIAQWNLKTFEPEKFAAQLPSIIYSICIIKEKNILLIGTSAGAIHVIDLIEKKEIKILQHHSGPVFKIKYDSKNERFYSVGGDGNFAVCSASEFKLVKIKNLCKEKIRGIDINYVAGHLAVASSDGIIRVFDLIGLELLFEFEGHRMAANCVTFSPDGNFLMSGGKDAYLNCWNVQDNYKLIHSIPAHNFAIYDIVYSPDSKLFATASRDKTIKIWDASNLQLLLRINKEKQDGHLNSVNKLLWSNYNNYLISTGDDRSIIVWEVLFDKA